jgi:hypothetical protein
MASCCVAGCALGDLPGVQPAGLSPDPQGRSAHGVLISIGLLVGGGVRLVDNIDVTATGCQSEPMPGNVPLLCLAGAPDILLCWNGRWVGKQADWAGLSRPVPIASGLLLALRACWAMLIK